MSVPQMLQMETSTALEMGMLSVQASLSTTQTRSVSSTQIFCDWDGVETFEDAVRPGVVACEVGV